MSGPLRLILFDVDGTLVDSQGSIVSAMNAAFGAAGLVPPARSAVLGIVGLSLDHAMARLAPQQSEETRVVLVQAYKEAFHSQRLATGAAHMAPMYPGAREMISYLDDLPDILLGVATGKSHRGLQALLSAHDLERVFVTTQVADNHPSKPHPSMIDAALSETGVEPSQAVMIGDTSFDMEMARAAGVPGIGVSWGYHARDHLTAAQHVIDDFAQLPPLLELIWEQTA